jgi:tetratricopeptide (TPR) repeat protein
VPPDDASRAVFEEALQCLADGDAPGAEAVCRVALDSRPTDVNLLGLLGAILLRLQRHADAEVTLRHTLELAPTFAKPWEDLGVLLLEQQRFGESIECLQRAVRLDPSLEVAHFNLGKALAASGRGTEADAAFEKSFALSPLRKLLADAVLAQREGRMPEAERLCRRVLQEEPSNVDALRLLAMCALAAGRAPEAERLLRRALALAPDYGTALIDLGRLLKDQDRFPEALALLGRAVEVEPGNAQGHFLLAATLAQVSRTADALDAYGLALGLQPRNAAAWLGMGHVLKTLGRAEEGVAAYRRCIELRPDNGESWWSLANLKTYRFSADDVVHMRARADTAEADPGSRVNFLFALAKAAEDRGDLEQAWSDYREGNRCQRGLVSYDPVQTEQMTAAIIQVFDAAFFAARKGWGDPDRAPIFVLGLPRSGSTLIEQILASHSAVEGTAELPYIGRLASALSRNRADGINYPEAAREIDARHASALGAEYLARAQPHRELGRRHFVDKMPNNFPNVGLIHLALPNALIIDARRHPLDTCVANFRQLYAKGQAFSYDLTELGEYWLQYERLMSHWDEVLPGRILRVDHEALVNDLEAQVGRLLAYCGLPVEPGCLRFWETERAIRTASSEQVRQPIYTDSVGQWQRYGSKLDELIEVLGPRALDGPQQKRDQGAAKGQTSRP